MQGTRIRGVGVYAGYRVEVDTPTRHGVVRVTRIGVSSRQYGHLFKGVSVYAFYENKNGERERERQRIADFSHPLKTP